MGSHSLLLWTEEPGQATLLSPWYFLGKNTGVGCHFLLQIFEYVLSILVVICLVMEVLGHILILSLNF